MQSRNPATGEAVQLYRTHDAEELERRIATSFAAWASWRETGLDERGALLLRVADMLEAEKVALGRLMTLEMGKPIRAAVAEAEKCAWACRYYAENGPRFLADEHAETEADMSWVRYEPIGPVLAIMPWNFPFWQCFRFIAPALMAGNTALLKHASNVPGCGLAIEDVMTRAGCPSGVFQVLMIGSDAVDGVIADPRIRAVTLTGSEAAGRAVGAAAGREIKTSVLELGGSDPFLVMPSADLDAALETAVKARIVNNGQSCIAAKRFIVHASIAERFIDGFVARMKALKVGDPTDESTDIGPLATEDIRTGLHEQVRASVAAGARVEELFGPVATIVIARDASDAIAIANETGFGLGASAWTNDEAERDRFVREIEAGMVFINSMVASDPRLPFGGVKRSGYGRELGRHGIREFVNVKAVSVQRGGAPEHTETE